MTRWRPRARWLLVGAPLAFVAVFYAWPVLALVDRGLRPEGSLDLEALRTTLARPSTSGVLAFTVRQALASTALTLLLGLPLAHVLARYRFRGRTTLAALVVVPFVLPTVVVASAFTGLLGPQGPVQAATRAATGSALDLRHSLTAIVLAHAFFNVAVVARLVAAVWERLDPGVHDAARLLGASRLRAVLRVDLPLLLPAILTAATITFLFSATSFALVLVLGGPTRATLEVEIWRRATHLLDLPGAAALALVQVVAVVALLVATVALERRAARALPLVDTAAAASPVRGAARWWVGGVLLVVGTFLAAPLAVMLERSFATGDGHTLAAWRSLGGQLRDSVLFVPPLEAVGSSLRTAALATLLAVPLGLAAALALVDRASRWREIGLLLPLGTSAVTIGYGMLLAFSGPPLAIRSEPWLVPVAHAVVALPFVVRTVLPLLRATQGAVREAAAVAGASPGQIRRVVDLPIIGRAAAVAAGFAFAISLGEFGATTFLARARHPTVPLLIERLLGQPGSMNVAQAMALSTVLALLVVVVVVVAERLRPQGSGW